MNREIKKIFVYENWIDVKPSLIGMIYVDNKSGKEIVSFEFSENWLNSSKHFSLDPDLFFYSGRQYVPEGKNLFGFLEDTCPDRWGRLLMKRREAIIANREDRKPKNLTDIDFLLGVYDETRMGGLRFSLIEEGKFLSDDKGLATPPWASLRELEDASFSFENSNDTDEEKWLNQLIVLGSSLGGARPKASVLAPDNSLWIAKFPSKNDEINIGAWEMVVHDLAIECELNVPIARLEKFSRNGSTFLTKRFDRNTDRRIHFASAMTLLGQTDGANSLNGIGYLDLASIIRENGSEPELDLIELWKRIVFNIAISNTDDHLRNHGFLLQENGWKLSPLYDVNPSIYGENLSLNISEESSIMKFDLALNSANLYNIKKEKGIEYVDKVKAIVEDNWKKLAKKYGINRSEIERMAPAFDMRYK
jgi:serine/threonine-protein kinase HipA